MYLEFIKNCLQSPAYALIPNNDDSVATAIQDWIQMHPINEQMKTWPVKDIKTFAKNIIKNLPIVQIKGDNIASVQSHLSTLAKMRLRLRDSLLVEIREIKKLT